MVNKINTIDTKIPSTIGLVTKTQFDSDKQSLEKEIEDVDNTSGLVKKTDYSTKITEIPNDIPSIKGLVIELNTNYTEIEYKLRNTTGFFITREFNRLAKLIFDARMKEVMKSLASKSQVDAALDTAHNRKNKKNF